MRTGRDLTGLIVGDLTVISATADRAKGCRSIIWKCRCKCGTVTLVPTGNLTREHTTSCGCGHYSKMTKHGGARDGNVRREYAVWNSMKQRCRNPRDAGYCHYGARGITVCDRWLDFTAFIADMGPRPDGYTLERVDNELGYSPENCVWASQHDQTRNTRRNKRLTFNGTTLCLSDWARTVNIDRAILDGRLRSGWSVVDALTKPVQRKSHSSTS